ncbi:RNA polymerase sigma-70 factor [Mucilaginibacter sp. AW1-7]|jgi:RNA polymerase sigma-70 factor (ECF subfamily)|uniref:RNA polymerase sigma-70 factor n=1 Tax=unclassified Mucilaginibacter TaxID=2617802 RepID=UPI0008D0C09C|nr:RNA polymerase sigma-70 factor [Mucilaginibacter sp. OK283]SEO95790.1 RNA polymerase sigma-70 factor, ECF subfamily [Mucilaginibacter sp. OK283]
MLNINIKDLLIKIARDSDLASFKKIYFLYYERLLKLACSYVKVTEVGEEIVDDVFVKIWANRAGLTEVNNLTVYLYVAVKNRAINHNLSNRITCVDIESVSFELKDANGSVEDVIITDELAKIINYTIQRLPDECKVVFKLVKEDGLKYRKVAEILNISVKTVEYHMKNALKAIATAISASPHHHKRTIKKASSN